MRVRLLVAVGLILLGSALATGCGLDLGRAQAEDASDGPSSDTDTDGAGGTADEDSGSDALGENALVVVDDGVEVHDECEHREVVVTADDAVVVLDGACGLVRATGRGSVVDVGSADKIVLVGVDNRVSFAGGDPEVINQGRNTTVAEGGTARE